MAGPIASLLVTIGADTTGLDRGVKQSAKNLKELGSRAAALGKQMAALGAAATAAGTALVSGLVKSGLSAIDAQSKLAQSMQGTVDGLRTLTIAAENAGLSQKEMEGNLLRMNRRLGEMARTGGGPAAAALNKLGLSAQDLLRLPLEQRVAVISEEISKLSTGAEMASLAFAIFGDAGIKMVPMLKGGSAAIREAAQEVRDYGLSLSQVDVAKIEQANDAIAKIGRVFEAIRNQITIAFAPILKELAERFNAVARANQGFADQARSAAEMSITAFAKVADVVQGLRVLLKGVELIAHGFGAAFVLAGELIIKVFATISDAVTKAINLGIRAVNQLGASIEEIPLFQDSAFIEGLTRFGDAARDKVGEVRQELHDLAMQDLPSGKVEAFLEDVRRRAQEAAQAAAAVSGGVGDLVFGESDADRRAREQAEAEIERQREALQRRLAAVAEFMASERDLEVVRHEERLQTLQESLEQELITLEEYHIAAQMLEEGHAERMRQIRERNMTDLERFTSASFGRQVKTVTGHLADMTAGVARENRAMFEANKVAGIANAIVNAYEGISLTMSKYPYPLNIGMAAAHAAAAFAQVQAIRSQTFAAGGGAAPSLAGGTPATPVTPVTGGTPASAGGSGGVLTVEGVSADSLFSGRAVRELMDRIAEHIRDGGTVQFA